MCLFDEVGYVRSQQLIGYSMGGPTLGYQKCHYFTLKMMDFYTEPDLMVKHDGSLHII